MDSSPESRPVAMDRAGPDYWSAVWNEQRPVRRFGQPGRTLIDHARLQLHHMFQEVLVGRVGPGSALIELGCGGSVLLPYFAKEYGLKVFGLDYAPEGCRLAGDILREEGVEASIEVGDIFDPPTDYMQRFDVVFSNGLVEHFNDTSGVFRAVAAFARRGGLVVTLVPNMNGIVGLCQRLLAPEVFSTHLPLTVAQLRLAQERAGLHVESCGLFQNFHLGVVNTGCVRGVKRPLRDFFSLVMKGVTVGVWFGERRGMLGDLRPSTWRSPYIASVART
jgi:cyclopropane fatty-acyl-phospholipid synthase-like methyltransferase